MQESNLYGVDWDGPLPMDDGDSVVVPTTSVPLCEDNMQQLASQINPLAVSYDFGIDLYLECLQLIHSRL